jgi:hypothetical protein
MPKDPTDHLLEREKSKKLRQMSAKMGFRPSGMPPWSIFPAARSALTPTGLYFVLEGLPYPQKQFTAEGWV